MMLASEFKMPLLSRHIPDGFPKHVLIPLSCEGRALRNHGGQSFLELAQRGGLGPDEAVAIMEDRRWRKMDVIELVYAFRKYHWIDSAAMTNDGAGLIVDDDTRKQAAETKRNETPSIFEILYLRAVKHAEKYMTTDEQLADFRKLIAADEADTK